MTSGPRARRSAELTGLWVRASSRVKEGAWVPGFKMRSSMPVLKRSSVAFSEMARRSGWTRARVFWVMRSSWSCRDSFVLADMAPPPYLKCVKVFEAETLALDSAQITTGLNVAVRPKPDWCDGCVNYIGGVKRAKP